MGTLRERLSKFRIHRIKVIMEYEGETLPKHVREVMARAIGDMLAMALRERSESADATFTLGMHQDVDVEEDET